MKQRTSIITGVTAASLAAVFVFGAALVQNGTICMVWTGGEPPRAYFDDRDAFAEAVARMRGEVLAVLQNQFNEDTGFFVYSMDPNGRVSEENNAIRQLLASRVLALESAEREAIAEMHRKNLNEIFSQWYREEGDVAFVYYDEKSKLGANAMLLRVLVASPYFHEYAREAEKLRDGILSLMNEDGSFSAWLIEPDYESDEAYLLTFYSGEAILALLEYGEAAGDTRALMMARRAEDFYIGEYADRIDENYYPAYVPWHTQSLALLYEMTGETRYRDAIYLMNDRLLALQDRESYVGRFYNPETPQYGSPHASSDAIYTEGLAYAQEIASGEEDAFHEEKFHDAVIYGTYNLMQLQHRARPWQIFMDREASARLDGGVTTHACNESVRIDTLAHAYDALTAILKQGSLKNGSQY